MKRSLSVLIAMTALALGLLASTPASAHTNFLLVGNQILNGGEVNLYGAADNVQIDDGPAADGTLIFTNLDPESHTLLGTCTSTCVGSNWSVDVASGEQVEIVVGLGNWLIKDADDPNMRGRVRVTSSEG